MQTVTAFPLVHALALDHPEHGIVGGLIQGPGTACACSACLTPKDSLGDIVGAIAFPARFGLTRSSWKRTMTTRGQKPGCLFVGAYCPTADNSDLVAEEQQY